MTYEKHIVARRGHMGPQGPPPDYADGELIVDEVEAFAVEVETGLAAGAVAETDEEALEAAAQALEQKIRDWAHIENRARDAAKEDPMVRLAQLEAFAKEHGFDG